MAALAFPGRYALHRGHPADVITVLFNRLMTAWQTQWASMKGGESLLVTDAQVHMQRQI